MRELLDSSSCDTVGFWWKPNFEASVSILRNLSFWTVLFEVSNADLCAANARTKPVAERLPDSSLQNSLDRLIWSVSDHLLGHMAIVEAMSFDA